ncbi:O-acetylhomoserine aminocarboxypropyltransferase/cysteine synthase family protein [Flexivirga alba]|uniref:O-acetylhomoserine aminocarboxypropyltransferase/cysteine synthase family protein n=1 Tax=Flexivirga alba TaxID=702742 RepID=A0ABW2AGM7_9MICO
MHDETAVLHFGFPSGQESTRATSVPIYQTVAHDFESAAHAGAIFDMEIPGFHYNRLNNPTNSVLEDRMAELERGTSALTVASGTAAMSYAVLNVASAGCNIVSTPHLYGGTYTYFAHVLPTFGVDVRLGENASPEAIAKHVDANTRAIFCESIGNPAGDVTDLDGLAQVAREHGVPLIVDNTVPTPFMLKPILHGADVVIHSLTKFIGGHGTTLGGCIIDGGSFDWMAHGGRFPMFSEPDDAFHGVTFGEAYPRDAFVVRARSVCLRNTGATLAPFNAFLILQGLETLPVRLERHEKNARRLAEYLAQDDRVEWVSFAGLPDDLNRPMARRYLGDHVPSIITFGPRGGYDAAIAFHDSVQLFKRLVNLGDARSLVSHSASTTHRQLSPSELRDVGIRPETIRLSVGLEHIEDLLEDVDQALTLSQAVVSVAGQ